MCSRYTCTRDEAKLRLREKFEVFGCVPRADIRPTDLGPVIIPEHDAFYCRDMNWGWTVPWDQSPLINAESETLTALPAYRHHLHNRCPLLADGFYEKGVRFVQPGEPVFCLAGLWRAEAGGNRFTMLTTTPNATVAPFYHRTLHRSLPPLHRLARRRLAADSRNSRPRTPGQNPETARIVLAPRHWLTLAALRLASLGGVSLGSHRRPGCGQNTPWRECVARPTVPTCLLYQSSCSWCSCSVAAAAITTAGAGKPGGNGFRWRPMSAHGESFSPVPDPSEICPISLAVNGCFDGARTASGIRTATATGFGKSSHHLPVSRIGDLRYNLSVAGVRARGRVLLGICFACARSYPTLRGQT